MQATQRQLLATLYPDDVHNIDFEALWTNIYSSNQTIVESLLLAPDIAFIALEIEGEILTHQPQYAMGKMEFTLPIQLVVVNAYGDERKQPYGLRFTFDETVVKWSDLTSGASNEQLNLPSMFNVSLDTFAGSNPRSISLRPVYNLDEQEAIQYVQDYVLDGLLYKVNIANPSKAIHISNSNDVADRDVIVVGDFDCMEKHKASLVARAKAKVLAEANKEPKIDQLDNLATYIKEKVEAELGRVTKVSIKFSKRIEHEGKTASRNELFFKQRGFVPTTFDERIPAIQFFKKETPTATLFVSPLIAFQVDKDGNYAIAYNLFEESIVEASTRLSKAQQKLMASVVLETDLRTK